MVPHVKKEPPNTYAETIRIEHNGKPGIETAEFKFNDLVFANVKAFDTTVGLFHTAGSVGVLALDNQPAPT